MKTILFIDKREEELWSFFLKYDFLLDEFKKDGHFAVCEWNSAGLSVDEAIPGVEAALGEESEWQAVVVSDLRLPYAELREDVHFDNPFDFSDSYAKTAEDGFAESGHPIIRLNQMLGGLPQKTRIDWPEKYSENVDMITGYEITYDPGSEDYDIIERYRLGLPRPKRIICVTPRDVDEAFYEARDIELKDAEVASDLDFWQRNGYPSITRFVVYDREAPAKKSTKRLDLEQEDESASNAKTLTTGAAPRRSYWFYFWIGVLSLMTAMPDDSRIKAFDVYRMSVDVNEGELQRLIGRRRAEWVAAVNAIEDRCLLDSEKMKSSEYVMAKLPDTETSIPVSFDLVNAQDLFVDDGDIRLVKDEPQKDILVWGAQRKRSIGEFKELMRAPRRALRNAAARFRSEKPIPERDLEYCVLNEYQQDKLGDEIRGMDYWLASDAGFSLFNSQAQDDILSCGSADVVKSINSRSTKRPSLSALAIGVVLLLIGFAPYCAGLMGGTGASLSAILVSVACVAVMFLVWLLTMVRMRNEVRGAFGAYNDLITRIVNDMGAEARKLESKISTYATFRKKWSVLDRQGRLGEPTLEGNRLGYRKALLQTRIADVDEITHDCELAPSVDVKDIATDWESVSRDIEDDGFYTLGRSFLRRSSVSNAGDNDCEATLDAPYLFVDAVVLDRLKVR